MIPYEYGSLSCTITDLIKDPRLVLCNENGDALFYYDDFEGQSIFLVSPVLRSHSTRMQRWERSKTEVVPWERYSHRIGNEVDFLITRRLVRRACRFLGLNLEKRAQSEKQLEASRNSMARLQAAQKGVKI